jgi:nucleoside-diphosphate-sugar epimerase
MKTALVTGASGFIGSHCLAPLLDRGYEVHAVRSNGDAGSTAGVVWHRADLLDSTEVSALLEAVRPTHLLHLAWYMTPGRLHASLEDVHWTRGSLDLHRRFAELGGERAVTSGSSYEYDWRYGFCSERLTPLAPDTTYGICKKALSDLLDVLSQVSGLSNAWARIFFLYGPREHPDRLVASVIRSLLAAAPARCSHGEQIRDYLHVQDAADALVALLDSDLRGPVNIGSGTPVALKEIVAAIADKLERPDLVELGAIPARPNDAPLVVADVTRLGDELGWRPTIELDAGLDQTIDWWRGAEAAR